MPPPRMDIRMIKDVLRLKLHGGLSHEAIGRSLSISKGVVAKYVSLAAAGGLDWATVAGLGEAELERRLLGRSADDSRVVEPDFGRIHVELRRKGVTLTLLGPTLALADGSRGQVFVAAMGASSYTFACVTADQTMRSWLAGIQRTLRFLGGVPRLIVPDNPRALIAEPDRYEPQVNETVLDFCRHYDVSMLPARPYSPQDKAKVESAVQVVERWILARLRHERLADVAAADRAVGGLLAMLNGRRFQKIDATRASLFASLDAPALRALPAQAWSWATWRTVTVHIDYHVEIEAHRYSVPHALVGLRLQARVSDALIELLHRGERVAVHARSSRRGGYTTRDDHMPAAHRAHKEWTPERLIHWGASIGPATGAFVAAMLERHRHPEHGYRGCLGLLGLARRYGRERLEAACALAMELNAIYYRHVKEILANGRDRIEPGGTAPWVSPVHDNVRGPGYYH